MPVLLYNTDWYNSQLVPSELLDFSFITRECLGDKGSFFGEFCENFRVSVAVTIGTFDSIQLS